MKCQLRQLFGASLIISLSPVVAFAAAGGHGDHAGIESLMYPWINFVIYVCLAYFFLRKTVAAFASARREGIQQAIKKAEDAVVAAQAKLSQAETQLSGLEQHAKTLRATIEREAALEAEAIINESKNRAARIVEQSKRSAEAELRGAEAAISRELAESALRKAREQVMKELNPQRDQLLRGAAARRLGQLH